MELKGRKVLVTGAGGFIPSHLTHRLVRSGAKVAIVTKYNSVMDNPRLTDIWDDLEVIEADLRNFDALRKVSQWKPEIVYHCAAYNHVGDSFGNFAEALDSNIKGTANLLECWQGYERFVYVSSSEVYGYQTKVPWSESFSPKPISPYAVGKYGGDLLAQIKQTNRLPVVIIRPFNTFGPYQSPRAIIGEMIIKCLSGKTIVSTKGVQTREFNYVSNIVDAFILAVRVEKAVGQIINVGAGEEIKIKDLILLIHKLTGSKSKLEIGKLKYRPTEIWRMKTDNAKAKKILGWKPRYSFREGLGITVEWYRKFLEVYADKKSGLSRLARWDETKGK